MTKGKLRRSLLRRALRSIVTLKGSPEAIALGTAIGVVIAFTPTIGFQMLLGALIATILGASRPAAMAPSCITNPLTIPPVYAFTYWLGSFFWKGPPASDVYGRLVGIVEALGTLRWYQFVAQFTQFLRIGLDVWIAMMIGGLIVGGICAAASYPFVLRGVRAYRNRLEERRRRRAEARARREPPSASRQQPAASEATEGRSEGRGGSGPGG